jgi:hypothetical protein
MLVASPPALPVSSLLSLSYLLALGTPPA